MKEVLRYPCPTCGTEVEVGSPCAGCAPHKARNAPTRGKASARRKPERQAAYLDGLDLPDEDFDYDEFVAREFGKHPHRRLGVKAHWWWLGVFLLLLLIAGVLRGFF